MTQREGARPKLDIRKGWELRRLKHVASIWSSNVDKKSAEGERPVRLCNYLDVYRNDRITDDLDFMAATASDPQVRRFELQRGDVLITKDSEDPADIAVPAFVVNDLRGVLCGYHLALIRPYPGRLDGRFLFYACSSRAVNWQFQVAANGITRFGIPSGEIGAAEFPLPPLNEQRAIADFLDERTGAIDTLIDQRQRSIQLWRDRRKAVITHCLTRGIDAETRLQDSGVPTLGEVPVHWRVVRLRHLSSVPFMYGANEPADKDDRTDPRYIRITDLTDNGDLRSDTFRSLPADVAQPYLLEEGDILLARSGATVGKAVRYRTAWGRACFAGYLIRFRADRKQVTPEYIELFTQSGPYEHEIRLSVVQATIPNVGAQRYGEFVVPVPPLEEQRRIAAYVSRVTYQTDNHVSAISAQIERLKEYRQTLVSAAVTGQIDVRREVAA